MRCSAAPRATRRAGREGLPALRRALDLLLREAPPRSCFRLLPCRAGERGARIGGRDIAGEALARALQGCGTAALICATLGQAADRLLARAQVQDMAWALMLDACASALVEEAAARALRGAAEAAGLCRGAATAPGYAGFPLGGQQALLDLIDARRAPGRGRNRRRDARARKVPALRAGAAAPGGGPGGRAGPRAPLQDLRAEGLPLPAGEEQRRIGGREMLKELGKRIVLLDGAMGTQLQARGLAPGELPETWNLTRPEDVQAIHEAYLAAGADVVTTNTFGANALKYGEDAAAVVRAGVEIARAAVRRAGRGLVALDLGPTAGSCGRMATWTLRTRSRSTRRRRRPGRAAGADLALVETMSDAYELKAAVLAAKEAGLPVLATVTLDETGRLLSGADVQVVAALLEGLGVMAMGMNCGLGPREMFRQMAALRAATDLPLLVQPNAGLPREEGGVAHYDVSPEEFAAAMAEICGAGAWMVGGCCGTTPAHIAAMAAACREIPPKPLPEKAGGPVVTSGSRAVDLSRAPIVIGERINPTGKPRLKRALRSRDIGLLQQEAVQQAERGADVLDVNVGLPDIDEEALLPEAVQAVQAVCDLPVQIDTASPAAMEAALRRCNGIPLLNSVSGKRESLEKVLPLAKKYGGVVVGLLLDEGGIPETAEGRVEIARRIVRAAEDLGIPRRNLVLDALTMTISTGSDNARVTLEALRRCKQELGVRTVLGVSNISFGLPQRETVNAAFLTMALAAGLDAAILNPMSEAMMRAFRASLR